jgi:hypothetical protein
MIDKHGALLLVLALLPACGASDASDSQAPSPKLTLELVAEKKLSKLLPTKDVDHYEASGIVASDGMLYVASDNITNIAIIDSSLSKGTLGPGETTPSQYEAITVSDDARFFTMIETETDTGGGAEVAELGSDTAFVSQSKTDAAFEAANNGFEGAAWLRVEGREYLLALCQNNDCKGDDGRKGEGRVRLLAQMDGVWVTQATLKLPESANFASYSDLALRRNEDGSYAVAVVSRKSSALWLGALSTSSWTFTGQSQVYAFPRAADGSVKYCSVEGVTFLGPNVVAAVSDKSDDGKPCTEAQESIHLFQLPQ